jgi:hypothetical protein
VDGEKLMASSANIFSFAGNAPPGVASHKKARVAVVPAKALTSPTIVIMPLDVDTVEMLMGGQMAISGDDLSIAGQFQPLSRVIFLLSEQMYL